jgi:hypothetical protein
MYLRESRHALFVLLPVCKRTALISRPECLTHTQLDSIVSSATRRYKNTKNEVILFRLMKTNIYILVNGRSLCIRRVLTTLFRASFILFFTVLILFHPFCLSSTWKLFFYTMYFFLLNTIGYILLL